MGNFFSTAVNNDLPFDVIFEILNKFRDSNGQVEFANLGTVAGLRLLNRHWNSAVLKWFKMNPTEVALFVQKSKFLTNRHSQAGVYRTTNFLEDLVDFPNFLSMKLIIGFYGFPLEDKELNDLYEHIDLPNLNVTKLEVITEELLCLDGSLRRFLGSKLIETTQNVIWTQSSMTMKQWEIVKNFVLRTKNLKALSLNVPRRFMLSKNLFTFSVKLIKNKPKCRYLNFDFSLEEWDHLFLRLMVDPVDILQLMKAVAKAVQPLHIAFPLGLLRQFKLSPIFEIAGFVERAETESVDLLPDLTFFKTLDRGRIVIYADSQITNMSFEEFIKLYVKTKVVSTYFDGDRQFKITVGARVEGTQSVDHVKLTIKEVVRVLYGEKFDVEVIVLENK